MGMRRKHWAKSRPMFLPSHYFARGPPVAAARRSSLLRAADTWDWPRITKVGRSPTGSLHAASRPSCSNTGWDKNTFVLTEDRRLSLGPVYYLTRDHQLTVHQAVVFQEPLAPLESRVFPWKVAQTVFYDFLLPSRLPRGVCLASPAPLSIVLLAM